MKYDEISRLSETDLFKVENEKGDCGVADITGKLIVECKYDYINLVSWDYDSYNEIYMIKAEYSDDFKDLYNNAGTFICHSDEGFGWGGLSMIYGTNPGNNNHVVIISNDDEDDDYYYVANGKKINTKDFGGTFYNYVANIYLDEDNQKLKIYDDNFELSKEIEYAYGYELLYGEEDKTYIKQKIVAVNNISK